MKFKSFSKIKTELEKIFINRNLAIEDILSKTSEVLSEMTNLTTMIIGPNIQNETLLKVDLIPLDSIKALVIISLSNGHIENKIFNFKDISLHDLKIAVHLFNKRLENTKLINVNNKIELIKPILENQIKKSEYILQQFVSAITNITKIKKTTYGLQYMLENPEFNSSTAIQKVMKLMDSISSFEYFKKQTNSNKNTINVCIGNETGDKEYDDISLISTKYKLNNNEEGTMALVGPKRIEYNKMMELLEWLTKQINSYSNSET